MRRLGRLCAELDTTPRPEDRRQLLLRYLREAPPEDSAWTVHLLGGASLPRRLLRLADLQAMASDLAGVPDWLFEASHQAVGDLAETIALLLPDPPEGVSDVGLGCWMQERLLSWQGYPVEVLREALREALGPLDADGRWLLLKLVTAGYRPPVETLMLQQVLAEHAGLDPQCVALRWADHLASPPDAMRFLALLAPEPAGSVDGRPHAFMAERPLHACFTLPADPAGWGPTLGPVATWSVQWRGGGLRAQIVRRGGQVWVWTEDGALLGARGPELLDLARAWPDGTVVEGEALAWDAARCRPLPLAQLRARLARKRVTRELLAQVPLRFIASDLLEHAGEDWRSRPLWQRQQRLVALAGEALPLAPWGHAPDWPTLALWRETAREAGFGGLLLRRREAAHGEGPCCFWAPEALCVEAVLVYAEPGTSYSFAVWSRPPVDALEAQAVVEAIARREAPAPGALQLVAFAKVAVGAIGADRAELDEVVRLTTLQKFGPVRSVRPTLVVALGLEAVERSRRHKSGLSVRGARVLRLRADLPLQQAGTLAELRRWLPPGE